MDEATIRLMIFLGILLGMAAFEVLAPRRALRFGRGRRWVTNLAIVATDTLLLRVVFPAAAVGVAIWAASHGYGLFAMLEAPVWLAAVLGFVLLDFAVWFEHWASHKIPLLWRIHKMHHADPDFDVTTALRFHPLEIIVSMLWKALIVVAFGIPVTAVLVFEVVLNGAAMFNHANVRLPGWLDRALRLVIVTPDMHRVHHSVVVRETDSNYGFNLSLWDRLFRTYTPQPEAGHDRMTIGLAEYQSDAPTGFAWCLALPFRKAVARPAVAADAGSGAPADPGSVKADREIA